MVTTSSVWFRMVEILDWVDLKKATKIAEIHHEMTGIDVWYF